jgi:hypothetical protein
MALAPEDGACAARRERAGAAGALILKRPIRQRKMWPVVIRRLMFIVRPAVDVHQGVRSTASTIGRIDAFRASDPSAGAQIGVNSLGRAPA